MNAFDLIDSIFSRVQAGVPGHQRRVTAAQMSYLLNLIDADPEGGALRPDGPGRLVWAPAGRTRYELTEEPRMVTRLMGIYVPASGRLFQA